MSLLDQIIDGVESKPYRVFLYGVECIGKSTWASQAESPIFLNIEDGLWKIACKKTPKITKFDTVLEVLRELYSTQHSYKTVVLDSADWCEALIWKKVCEDHEKDIASIAEIGYGKGFDLAMSHWHNLLHAFDVLRDKKGMNIVILAHSKIEKYYPPDQESYDVYSPKLHKSASSVIREWADAVLFARYVVHTKKTGDGFQKRNQAIACGDRQFVTNELPSCLAKNRFGMPETISMEFSEFDSYVKNS